MTTSLKIGSAVGHRAGVPLARAHRLASQAEKTSKDRSWVLSFLGLATVGALVAYGIYGQSVPSASAAEVRPQAVQPVVAASAPDPAPDAAPEVTAAQIAPLAPVVEASASAPVCINTIQTKVEALQVSVMIDTDAAHQDAVAELLQSTLDCESATLRIEGSLELFGSGLAALRVRWDSDVQRLDLAMIDTSAAATDLPVPEAGTQTIEFVIR